MILSKFASDLTRSMKRYLKYVLLIGIACWAMACQQETSITSVIHVDGEGTRQAVNPDLYGITLEEINHAIDGGLYAEMIQNRSFEDGIAPLNCPYNARQRIITTPNGYDMPFMRPDSLPGWKALSPSSWLYPDTKELLNEKNRRSLLVSVSATPESGRGGVVAEGYNGLAIRKGESYHLSFYIKGASLLPKTLTVALEDSTRSRKLSDVCTVKTRNEWTHIRHTFTANESTHKATLVFSSDSSQMFWIDVVSLFPETWKGRANGQRQDLMEKIAQLHPRFVRFPGGAFVEGYTAGTYPVWNETIGNITERKSFWSVWGYGTTNGMGFHEYLQLCEDLGAEPIYVINSGITNMSRRPRYESITEMDKLVQNALDAIGYANYPADSTLGAMRAKNGHPQPFHLKYIEIGSENYGHEYTKRFNLFRKAIKEKWPDIMVISNALVGRQPHTGWKDVHFNGKNSFFLNNASRYGTIRSRHEWENTFIGEFGNMQYLEARTMGSAISEGCFLIGIEQHPGMMSRLAYSPLLGNADYLNGRWPMLLFNNHQVVPSPSYYMMRLFNEHRGREVLPTHVDTYLRPTVTFGGAAVYMFDNCYELTEVSMDGKPIEQGKVLSGNWNIQPGILHPVPNRWNYVLLGDTSASDYTFHTRIRRTKGSELIQFRMRDKGLLKERQDYICFTLGNGKAQLYHQCGNVTDSLATTVNFPFVNNTWYDVRISCHRDTIRCFVDENLIQESVMRPYPSLASVATIDNGYLYIKVINTTRHEEKTEINIQGLAVENQAEIIELAGEWDARNTFEHPDLIRPVKRTISFTLGMPKIYKFPPSSISILKFKLENS